MVPLIDILKQKKIKSVPSWMLTSTAITNAKYLNQALQKEDGIHEVNFAARREGLPKVSVTLRLSVRGAFGMMKIP